MLGLIAQPALAQKKLSTPFSYYAENQNLSTVLTQFARSQRYNISLSSSIQGNMSGRFDNVEPKKFLDGIYSAFGVKWYTLERTLYFYNESELTRAYISPKALDASTMYNMLKKAHAFSPELMPRFDGQDVIVISGPSSYIQEVTNLAQSFEHAHTTNYVMRVFPLKFAWADDMTINSTDQTITVPGVATILRSMVLGSASSATSVVQHAATAPRVAGLLEQSSASQANSTPQNTPSTPIAQNASAINIMADSRVNSVIINDAAYRMPYYEKVIADLDKPVELVEIHAAIVDIDTNFTRNLGVNFQVNFADGNFSGSGDMGGNTSLPSGTGFVDPTGGLGLSTIYTAGFGNFLARIEALETDGDARILGRPSVLTVDNVQASLENTSTLYVQVEGTDVVDLFEVEAGTILRVTPHIIHDEKNGKSSIKLAVHVQDNQNSDSSPETVEGAALPPIRQTKINTQAIVGEGESLLIGGYYYEQISEGENGVPILMDLPFFGHLFKSSSKNSKRMERLILITPRIINHNEPPKLPEHTEFPDFHRSASQNTYEERIPQVEPVSSSSGGCSRKNAHVQEPTMEAQY